MAVNATAIWRVRPSGNNTNGGGYDPAISGAGTDYSQQNAAQATGTNGATTGTTNFADTTANAFTSAMVGNAIYITGTGQTTGFYFVTAFVDVGNVTLDRSPGTGTGATWSLGGGWADFWTNCSNAAPTPVIAGNIVYILGSGTPNPASYTYDYTASTSSKTLVSGSETTRITFANDPGTPGYKSYPDTTGGMPTVKCDFMAGQSTFGGSSYTRWHGIWFVLTAADSTYGIFNYGFSTTVGCVFDTLSHHSICFYGLSNIAYFGCEFFSSTAQTTTYSWGIFSLCSLPLLVNCNFHDLNMHAIYGQAICVDCIFSKNNGSAITALTAGNIINCTIDGNKDDGILVASGAMRVTSIHNCIISNHIVAGKYGINLNFGSAAANSGFVFYDYNVFYNNTADLINLNYGPHDTHGGPNPYVGQATQNYMLK